MNRTMLIVLLAGLACACTHKESPLASLPDMSAVRANLAFTCVHEADHLPVLDRDADKLFQYGRYLEKKDGPKDFNDIARYYRIAAAHRHYKANQNLQLLVSQGFADSPDAPKESVDLAAQLVNQGIPGGYYDIGHYLELGYGLKQDTEMALRYMRKAADLGNPDAQYYVGEKLAPVDVAPAIAKQMWRCAADQGHGKAANTLGVDLQADKFYAEAVKVFQLGVGSGDRSAASFLEYGFNDPPPSDQLNYIALPHDPERSRRYKLIGKFLDDNDGRNPKVLDIDKIVPLPPAPLPAWDGTFQWEKDQAAAVPPPKPSDDLIKRLSEEKHLDPATGLPLAKPDHVSQTEIAPPAETRLPIGTIAQTGESCPEKGVWRAALSKGMVADAEYRFPKGVALPSLTVYRPRAFASLDERLGVRKQTVAVEWRLQLRECENGSGCIARRLYAHVVLPQLFRLNDEQTCIDHIAGGVRLRLQS
ncbi:sel1 repeat family protein [Trinickia sp. Y13]|nr:sel1 repeat family protein [Trinickia sp. Y13]